MLKKMKDKLILYYILNHLREEDKKELMKLYSGNWYEKTIESLENQEFLVLYGVDDKKNNVPIAIGGVDPIFNKSERIACVWLLSTIWVRLNKKLFLNTLKTQSLLAEKEFDILFNFIYESNCGAKKWIKKLGFKFDNPKPKGFSMEDGFEFFYKSKERKD